MEERFTRSARQALRGVVTVVCPRRLDLISLRLQLFNKLNARFQAGWTFRMSTYPALQNLINPTMRGFFRRMVRWSRLRIKMLPGPFSFPLLPLYH